MRTLSDDELQHVTQQLLAVVRRGEPTVITSDGRPVMLAVPLADGAPIGSALVDLTALLFTREEVSLGTAARIAGTRYGELIDKLGKRGTNSIRISPDKLERELADCGR